MGSPAAAAGRRRERQRRARADEASRRLSTGARSRAWKVLRSRNFGPYFIGNAASASGTWFQNLAASILVYRLTHSPFLLGVLSFCQFVPVLVLSPWAGALADRVDRRRLLLATQIVAAALSGTLAGLSSSGFATVGVVIGFTAALGVTTAIAQPAQLAFVSSLVERDDVSQAVAFNSATFNVARALGPVTAAAVIAWKGISVAFAVNACSFVLFAAVLLAVRARPHVRAGRARLRDGFSLVRRRPSLLLNLAIVSMVSVAADPVNTESPAIAHAFGRASTWAGSVVGAFGIGAVTAAFFFAGRTASSRRRMSITLVTMCAGMSLFALSPWLPLAYVFLALAGFGYLLSNTAATASLQLSVDEHERGRIMALWSIAFLGIRPLASLVDGALASSFGVRAAAIALALPLFAAGAFGLRSSGLRRARLAG